MASANQFGPFGEFAPSGMVARILRWTRSAPSSWLGRRRAFFLRAMAVRLMGGKPADVESLGARMRLYPYNNVCEKRILFMPRQFDLAEREFLLARLSGDFVFIDIGANVGGYALAIAAHAGPRARILAIEPQPEIFERLIYNVRQNPFANVKAIDCAVADADGEITLFLDRHNRGETSVRIVSVDGADGSIRVPSKRLATIVAEEGFSRIDAIKLDVEGAEDLILEPFFRQAPRSVWPRIILMEHLHRRWAVDLPALLASYGYQQALLTKNNIAYELPPEA